MPFYRLSLVALSVIIRNSKALLTINPYSYSFASFCFNYPLTQISLMSPFCVFPASFCLVAKHS